MGEANLLRKGIKGSYGGRGRAKLEWGHQKGRREKKGIREVIQGGTAKFKSYLRNSMEN